MGSALFFHPPLNPVVAGSPGGSNPNCPQGDKWKSRLPTWVSPSHRDCDLGQCAQQGSWLSNLVLKSLAVS